MSETADTAYERGSRLITLGRGPEAEAHFRRALTSTPDDVRLHVGLARALLLQDRTDESLAVARQAVFIDPSDLTALFVLSLAQVRTGQLQAALATADGLLSLAPELSLGHHARALALLDGNDPAGALAAARRAQALDPTEPDHPTVAALALIALRRFGEAELALADAQRLDPDSAFAHHARGLYHLHTGPISDALEANQRALRLDPTDDDARVRVSEALKARNPLYAALLRYGLWSAQFSTGARIAQLCLPAFAIKLLNPLAAEHLWARVALVVCVAALALSWLLGPLLTLQLLSSPDSRRYVSRSERRPALLFLAYAVVGAAAWFLGWRSGNDGLMGVAGCWVIWALAIGNAEGVAERQPTRTIGIFGTGFVLAVVTLVLGATGHSTQPWLGLTMLSAVAVLWWVSVSDVRADRDR